MNAMEPTEGLLAFLRADPAVKSCNTHLIHTGWNILKDPRP